MANVLLLVLFGVFLRAVHFHTIPRFPDLYAQETIITSHKLSRKTGVGRIDEYEYIHRKPLK